MRPIRGCGLADDFMKVWKVQFACDINIENGIYSCKKECRRPTSSAPFPATLLPASKQARLEEQLLKQQDDISFDECKIDEGIKTHFAGKHIILSHP